MLRLVEDSAETCNSDSLMSLLTVWGGRWYRHMCTARHGVECIWEASIQGVDVYMFYIPTSISQVCDECLGRVENLRRGKRRMTAQKTSLREPIASIPNSDGCMSKRAPPHYARYCQCCLAGIPW
jgi:hypothetical protein